MNNLPRGTRLQLIIAAGEIFADHGFEGASIRAIAEKAGANIAAINYHFGSKKNLYKEAILYSHQIAGKISDFLSLEDEGIFRTRKATKEALRKIIRRDFNMFFSPEFPAWTGRLILRGLFDSHPIFMEIIRDVFIPDYRILKEFALKANPRLKEQQAHHWTLSFFGKISLYVFFAEPILMVLDKKKYDPRDIDAAVDYITRASFQELYPPTEKKK